MIPAMPADTPRISDLSVPDTADINVPEADLKRAIRGGTEGYQQLLSWLCRSLSAKEVHQAEDKLRWGLRRLLVVMAGAVAALLVVGVISTFTRLPVDFALQCISGSLVVSAVILVTVARLHWAAYLLVPFACFLAFGSVPITVGWDLIAVSASGACLIIACGFVLGLILDLVASTDHKLLSPFLRRCLIAWLAVVVALICFSGWVEGSARLVVAATASVVGTWCWWVAPRHQRSARLHWKDSEILFQLARVRWGRFATGRSLALLAGLFPLLLFLNSFSVPRRLVWPEGDHTVVRTRWNDQEVAWFWTSKGDFLRHEDLDSSPGSGFFGFLFSTGDEKERADELSRIWDKYEAHFNAASDRQTHSQLRDELSSYAIRNAEALQALFPLSFSRGDWQELQTERYGLFYLEEVERWGGDGPLYIAQDLWESKRSDFSGHLLIALSREELTAARKAFRMFQWSSLFALLLGFLLLWRRGGDSPIARWAGLSLLGISLVLLSPFNDFHLPSHVYREWHAAASNPLLALKWSIFQLMVGLGALVSLATLAWMPAARLWLAAFHPPQRRLWIVPQVVLTGVATIAIYAVISTGIAYFSSWSDTPPKEVMPALLHVFAMTLALVLLGFTVRRLSGRRNHEAAHFLVIGVLALQAVVLFVAVHAEELGSAATLPSFPLSASITVSVALLALAIAWQIIRNDLLHISTVRDFSFILLYIVLPFSLEWLVGAHFNQNLFTAGGMVSAEGGKWVAVIAAIFLLPRLHYSLGERFARISYPRLRQLRTEVESAVEGLASVSDRRNRALHMKRLFEVFGINRYALFARFEDHYRHSIGEACEGVTDGFRLSPDAVRFLAQRRAPLDLNRLALEWGSFFAQFELERLRQETEARYLLPICAERTLWGFVLLWDGKAERELTRLAIAEKFRPAALAALHQRVP